MGTLDISSGIDYVLSVTNHKRLIYIGHSQGTTALYALLSTKPEYNEKIWFHIGAAPVVAIPHTKSFLRQYVPFVKQIAVRISHNFF